MIYKIDNHYYFYNPVEVLGAIPWTLEELDATSEAQLGPVVDLGPGIWIDGLYLPAPPEVVLV